MFHVEKQQIEDKKSFYNTLNKQLIALLEGESNKVANLANASALLGQVLETINWVGFYLIEEDELILGPFQGKVACMHIQIGKGVCGTAVAKNETVRVVNVHDFPGHIACDSASQSEIVIPIRHEGKVIGVLDIDSPIVNRFDEEDQEGLEHFVRSLENIPMW